MYTAALCVVAKTWKQPKYPIVASLHDGILLSNEMNYWYMQKHDES